MRKKAKKLLTSAMIGAMVLSTASIVQAEDFVLYDENDVHIESKGLTDSASTGKIGLYIENNSNLNLGIEPHAYAINGIMSGGSSYGLNSVDVASGKKANSTIELVNEWKGTDFFKDYQIDNIASFDILFWAYDNDQSFKSFDSGQIHADISGETVQESPIFSDCKTFYDKDGIKIDFLDYRDNAYTYSITNTTGEYFSFAIDNISYNDFTSSDFDTDLYNICILNNCKRVITIKPSDEFLAENGINDVTKMDFSLKIWPSEDFTREYATDIVSVGW